VLANQQRSCGSVVKDSASCGTARQNQTNADAAVRCFLPAATVVVERVRARVVMIFAGTGRSPLVAELAQLAA